MIVDETAARGEPERRTALRMGAIAFLSGNIGIGAVFGTFSVLVVAVEARLGIGRTVSMSALSLLLVALAVTAAVAGAAAQTRSLRGIMILGSLLAAAGFALLALSPTLPAYLIAYGLLIGPGTCMSGTVSPPILVTRWFRRDRGRALGIVSMPLLTALLPVAAAALVAGSGVVALYWLLAALMLALGALQMLVVDRPPPGDDAADLAAPATDAREARAMLPRATFWCFVLAYAFALSPTVAMSAHIVPMAISWGIAPTAAAGTYAVMAGAGIVGAPLLGWLGDRSGGRTVAIGASLLFGALLALLSLRLPAAPLVAVLALMGLASGGLAPVFSLAIAQIFGTARFGRVFGLMQLVSLPFTITLVPLAAAIFERTHSYTPVLMLLVGCSAVSVALLLALPGYRRAAAAA